jgi:hypothetical protein
VTAGVTYDSMTDVPTLTSATAANYAVLNPLDKDSDITTSNGNLTASTSTVAHNLIRSTIAIPSSGKFYAEMRFDQTMTGSPAAAFALISPSASLNAHIVSAGNYSVYGSSGTTLNSGATGGATVTSMTSGQIWQFAVDADNNQAWVGLNNAWYNIYTSGATTGNPSAGTNPTFTGTMAGLFLGADFVNSSGSINFGQQPFTYTPPTGFVALNTYNLPASTITNGAAYMAATLYTGTGATQVVSNAVNGISMQPDLVWLKSRSNSRDHRLMDSVRGINNVLSSNLTSVEYSGSALSSINSNGFTLNTTDSQNVSSETYIGWQWKAGTTSASNTNGTITSTVSVGATQGFSVATYTGNGSSSATVGHGLGVAPSMIIVKARSGGSDWETFHTSLGSSFGIRLNTTAAKVAASSTSGGIISTSPTSTTFGFTAGTSNVNNANESGLTFVAYCFAAVAGYSAFGSYTGNGSTDGTFVYTGFRPRFIMFKCSTSAGTPWVIVDTSRNPFNAASLKLAANNAEIENGSAVGNTTENLPDINSNGFKMRSVNTSTNGSGETIIYMAFAESPFKTSLAR